MGRVHLTMAMGDYDHTRDLASGRIYIEGINLTAVTLRLEEIVFRCLEYGEWDISEMSMGVYTSMRAHGDDSLVAIPVFPSRMFRHSAFYVGRTSGITELGQLRDRRIGVPVWAQTACVYARALLTHEAGVGLDQVEWVQAGLDEPGRRERGFVEVPKGVRVRATPERTLSELLVSGEVDAVISARPPREYLEKTGRIRRLIDDAPGAAREYWGRTGIFPIMHCVVIKGSVYRKHPWVARNVYNAFCEARDRSVRRATTGAVAHYPLPLASDLAEQWRSLMGGTLWPYGVSGNERTLDAFAGYCVEQGVAPRRLEYGGLFAKETLAFFRS